jgi:hypothetical protein
VLQWALRVLTRGYSEYSQHERSPVCCSSQCSAVQCGAVPHGRPTHSLQRALLYLLQLARDLDLLVLVLEVVDRADVVLYART